MREILGADCRDGFADELARPASPANSQRAGLQAGADGLAGEGANQTRRCRFGLHASARGS